MEERLRDAPEKRGVSVQSIIWLQLQLRVVEEGEQDGIQAHYCTSALQQTQSEHANLPGQVSEQSAGTRSSAEVDQTMLPAWKRYSGVLSASFEEEILISDVTLTDHEEQIN